MLSPWWCGYDDDDDDLYSNSTLPKEKGKLNLHVAQAVTLNLHMQLG